MIGTSSSDEKLARAKTRDWTPASTIDSLPNGQNGYQQETGNRGADLIVEVGGAGTFSQSLQAVRFGGTVAQIGVLSQSEQPLPILWFSIARFASTAFT